MDFTRAIDTLYATAHSLLHEERPKDAACVVRAMVLAAPTDERGWLALGLSHEALGQPDIALEMYATGRVMAAPSPRCELARARVLRLLGRDDAAGEALDVASSLADGDEMAMLIESERRAS